MTRKEKLALRQHQSTRQLMGMQGIASHGITTSNSELVFFLIRPDNLSVLSSEGIRARVPRLCPAGGISAGIFQLFGQPAVPTADGR